MVKEKIPELDTEDCRDVVAYETALNKEIGLVRTVEETLTGLRDWKIKALLDWYDRLEEGDTAVMHSGDRIVGRERSQGNSPGLGRGTKNIPLHMKYL